MVKTKLKNAVSYSKERITYKELTVETYISTDNLLQNKLGVEKIKQLPASTNNTPKYNAGDILVSNIRPYLKKIYYAKCSGGVSADVLTLKTNSGYDSKFIYYSLFQDAFFEHMMSGSKGTKMPRGDKNQILEFEIPSYNFYKQQKIASVLSALDDKIELNNKINAELEAMAKTLYDYWFVQFDFPDALGKPYKSFGGEMVYNEVLKREIPKGWEAKSFDGLLTFTRGISYTSSTVNDISGVPMINLKSFNLNGTYRIDGLKYFTGKVKESRIISKGDLLIAITDVTREAEIIGRAISTPEFNVDVVCSCDVARVDILNNAFEKNYLRFLFNSKHYHNYIKHYASGTLVLHLDLNGIMWYKDIIPPMDLQEKFQSFSANIEDKIQANHKQNQELASLRDWLLPMLMNGKVTVKDAYIKVEEELEMVAEAKYTS